MNNTNRKSPRHGTRNLSFDRSVEKLAIPTIKQLRDLSLKEICGRIIQGMEIREVLPSICSSSPLLDPSKPMASLLIPSSKKHLSFILLKKWWPSRCHGADTQVLIPRFWYPGYDTQFMIPLNFRYPDSQMSFISALCPSASVFGYKSGYVPYFDVRTELRLQRAIQTYFGQWKV